LAPGQQGEAKCHLCPCRLFMCPSPVQPVDRSHSPHPLSLSLSGVERASRGQRLRRGRRPRRRASDGPKGAESAAAREASADRRHAGQRRSKPQGRTSPDRRRVGAARAAARKAGEVSESGGAQGRRGRQSAGLGRVGPETAAARGCCGAGEAAAWAGGVPREKQVGGVYRAVSEVAAQARLARARCRHGAGVLLRRVCGRTARARARSMPAAELPARLLLHGGCGRLAVQGQHGRPCCCYEDQNYKKKKMCATNQAALRRSPNLSYFVLIMK